MTTTLSTSSPLLLCAATRWEAAPLASALKLSAVSNDRSKGVCAGRTVVLIKTGVGPEAASTVLDQLGPAENFHCALSVGFAGALQPGMASGDLVLDIQGADAELPPAARELAAKQGTPLHFGRIIHSDKVLASPADKRALGQAQRASAVDMETSSIRAWAGRRGTPSLAVRVILDGVDDRLPSSVPAGEDILSLTRYALGNIGEMPVMISTGLKQRRAMTNLCRFLEEFIPLI
jgi:nucleoside phosphorylase